MKSLLTTLTVTTLETIVAGTNIWARTLSLLTPRIANGYYKKKKKKNNKL